MQKSPNKGVADPSLADVDVILREVGGDLENGLSSSEAARRLAENGPNSLRAPPPVPLWQRALAQFRDPLVYLLLAATVVSLVAWVADGRHGWPIDSLVIAAIVVANAVLGLLQELKAQNAVAALAKMTAVTSGVLRDGRLARVPSAELVRGDVLVLAEGDAIGRSGPCSGISQHVIEDLVIGCAGFEFEGGSIGAEQGAVLHDGSGDAGVDLDRVVP